MTRITDAIGRTQSQWEHYLALCDSELQNSCISEVGLLWKIFPVIICSGLNYIRIMFALRVILERVGLYHERTE